MIEASFEAVVPKAINAEFEAIIPREKAFDIVNKDIHIDANGRYKVKADAGTAMTQVNVEVDIQPKEFKDVNFYDYEGTILHSYTWDEFVEKNEMPPLPTHREKEGLICQEWNYTLEEVLEQGGRCDVGAMYIPHGEKTLMIANVNAGEEVVLIGTPTVANAVIVDWGDGTTTTNDIAARSTFRHTYKIEGEYNITIDVTSGKLSNFYIRSNRFCHRLHIGLRIDFGNTPSISSEEGCDMILTLPYGMQNSDARWLTNVHLKHLTIPRGLKKEILFSKNHITSVSIPNDYPTVNSLSYQSKLKVIHIPSLTSASSTDAWSRTNLSLSVSKNSRNGYIVKNGSLTSANGEECFIATYKSTFIGVTKLATNSTRSMGRPIMVMPDTLTMIGAYNFGGGIYMFDFSKCKQIPTLQSTTALASTISTYKIIIPAGMLDNYKNATNWSSFSSRFAAVTDAIKYYVDGVSLIVERGYTWQQMIDNNFNAHNFTISNGEVKSGNSYIKLNEVKVLATDVIQEEFNYTI